MDIFLNTIHGCLDMKIGIGLNHSPMQEIYRVLQEGLSNFNRCQRPTS